MFEGAKTWRKIEVAVGRALLRELRHLGAAAGALGSQHWLAL